MRNALRFLVSFSLVLVFSAVAAGQQISVFATGLKTPIKVRLTPGGNLMVAEGGTGPNTGRISILARNGVRRTLIDGLPSGINTIGAQPTPIGPTGLEIVGDVLYVAIGSGDETLPGAAPGTEVTNPNASSPILSSVLKLRLCSVDSSAGNFVLAPSQHAALKAGTELSLQNGAGETLKISLLVDFPDLVGTRGSNPFGLAAFGNRLFVVDASFNQIQSVDPATGTYTTLTTFPQIANPLAPMGPPLIDAVPDSIRVSNGQLLVTFLTGFPFPAGSSSAARVDPSTGAVQTFLTGLTTAIDVLPLLQGSSSAFVLEFSTDMNAGAPGRLVFIDPVGVKTTFAAPLITPTAMAFDPQTREAFITELGPGRISRISLASVVSIATCTPDATSLCLNGGRYLVRAAYRTPQGTTANGIAVSLTNTTGYFWFFSADNVEVVVKVVDGCSFNSRKWVFAGGLTNVSVTITVTDTQTGIIRMYDNPLNVPFQPVQDLSAFTCP